MQVANAVLTLEAFGYRFKAQGDSVQVFPPVGTPPSEAALLLPVLRENKPAVLEVLHVRATEFALACPSQGEAREITMNANDDAAMRRWAAALEAGLIILDGKVRLHTRSNIVRLRYRAVMPEEWIHDAVCASSKRQYHALFERIQKGEAWLKANVNDPAYGMHFERFLALFQDLRVLHAAIDQPPADPLEGCAEAMQ